MDHEKRLQSMEIAYTILAEKERDIYEVKDLWDEATSYREDGFSDKYFWTGLSDLDNSGILDRDGRMLEAGEYGLEDIELSEPETEEKIHNWSKYSVQDKVDSSDVEIYTDHFERNGFEGRDLGNNIGYMFERTGDDDEMVVSMIEKNHGSETAELELVRAIRTVELTSDVADLYEDMSESYLDKIWSQRFETLERREEPKRSQGAIAGI